LLGAVKSLKFTDDLIVSR